MMTESVRLGKDVIAEMTSRYNTAAPAPITPAEYKAELEYLLEVFKLAPKKSLYSSVAHATR